MVNIQLKINNGFGLFVFFPVSVPCDTRHAASLRKYIFWCRHPHNPFVEGGRDGACPVSPAKIKKYREHTIEKQWWFWIICILSSVYPLRHAARRVSTKIHFLGGHPLKPFMGVETGRAPCRQQKSKNIGNIQLRINDGFGQFVFFPVSFPCDTRHAASLRKYIFLADTPQLL